MRPDTWKGKMWYVYSAFVYLLTCLLSCHGGIIRSEEGSSLVHSLLGALFRMFETPFDIRPTGYGFRMWIMFTIFYAIALMFIKVETEKADKDARGREDGSARWNTNFDKYNRQYTDPKDSTSNDGPYNMIISDTVFLSMNTWQTRRNNNVMIIGGSGAGKSRFFVKPNLLQANCSYVITDPAGELLETQAGFLERSGYKIKVFNLVEMKYSNCYNPFNYVRDDLGVLMLINCLIKNTNKEGQSGGDPFWEKSETALLQALMFYLIKYRPKEEQNFTSIMKLLRAAEVDENNPNVKSPLDRIFDEVQKKDPGSIALKQYMTFKMGAGKTLKSILISCSVRLTVFNMKEIEQLTGTDDIDLGTIGDEKQALFVVIPAADDTYNFLVSMMYAQLFETLYFHAENQCKGKKLPIHVRFMLDEFANIGQIPDFAKKLATMRKYEISCSIILQNLAQIKAMYKDDWEGLIGNCDTFLFLGGQEQSTLEYISKELGSATILSSSTSRSFGKGGGSRSTQHGKRELMTPDEIMRMDNNKCITIIRGLYPFFTDKFDYPRHKNYKFTGDAEDSLLFDFRHKFNNEIKNNLKDLNLERQRGATSKNVVSKKINRVTSEAYGPEELGKILGISDPEELPNVLQGVGIGAKQLGIKQKSKTKINKSLLNVQKKPTDGEGFDIKQNNINIQKIAQKPTIPDENDVLNMKKEIPTNLISLKE